MIYPNCVFTTGKNILGGRGPEICYNNFILLTFFLHNSSNTSSSCFAFVCFYTLLIKCPLQICIAP